jgi:methionyl-tRNA formyltransferase
MKILFVGSGALACPALLAILERGTDHLVAVVTQPDRPRGRHLHLGSCPVKALASQAGAPLLAPVSINEPNVVERLARLKPDLLVVAAYGQMLKKPVLDLPRLAAVNIHPSLLPRFRGAAPVQWTLAHGDTMTGVTLLYVTARMDAGDLLMQEREPVLDEDTAVTLEARLAQKGARMLLTLIDRFREGPLAGIPQREEDVVFAPKLSKTDGQVDWTMSAERIRNRIRGFHPWPGSCCEAPAGSDRVLLLHKAKVEPGEGAPGEILSLKGEGPLVATGEQALRLLCVQPAGRGAMAGDAYARGARLAVGDRMG